MRSLGLLGALAGAAFVMEASGPVTRKKTREDYEREDAERAERNTRHYELLQRQQAEEDKRHAAQMALTTDAEWARIERDERRRADRKAAKKKS